MWVTLMESHVMETTDSLRGLDPARRGKATKVAFPVAGMGLWSTLYGFLAFKGDGNTIAGISFYEHAETPGLGDAIEVRKSPWINGFDGKSLQNPQLEDWAVRRDGGEFDQLTGATITPRAVVAAVRNTLLYYRQNADMLFR